MQTQVVVIHGGDSFRSYEDYYSFLESFSIDSLDDVTRKGWRHTMQTALGDGFKVVTPEMPNKFNARYSEWKLWFQKLVPLLADDCILIGHSLGGTFLAKYLAEEIFPKKIRATFLIAACFGDNIPEYELLDFSLPKDLSGITRQGGKVYVYHSMDDEVVPFTDLAHFAQQLPGATVVPFKDKGHFTQETFPELYTALQELGHASVH